MNDFETTLKQLEEHYQGSLIDALGDAQVEINKLQKGHDQRRVLHTKKIGKITDRLQGFYDAMGGR